jgi:hypothetical protein
MAMGWERSYHEPDFVMDLSTDALLRHIAQVQAEVTDAFRAIEATVAEQLVSDINRLVTRLGDLSPRGRALVRTEFLLQLTEHEADLTAEPSSRWLARMDLADRQWTLRRSLRESEDPLPTS